MRRPLTAWTSPLSAPRSDLKISSQYAASCLGQEASQGHVRSRSGAYAKALDSLDVTAFRFLKISSQYVF